MGKVLGRIVQDRVKLIAFRTLDIITDSQFADVCHLVPLERGNTFT